MCSRNPIKPVKSGLQVIEIQDQNLFIFFFLETNNWTFDPR
jgi:hypothetical protein